MGLGSRDSNYNTIAPGTGGGGSPSIAVTTVLNGSNPGTGSINSGQAIATSADAPAGTRRLNVVYVGCNNLGDFVTGVTDSAGNTYVQAVQNTPDGAQSISAIYYCAGPANDLPSGGTIAATTSFGGAAAIFAFNFFSVDAGAGHSWSIDKTNSSNAAPAGGTGASLSTATLSGTNEFALAGIDTTVGFDGYVEAAGWTTGDTFFGGGVSAYIIQNGSNTAITYNPTWTDAKGGNLALNIASFLAT